MVYSILYLFIGVIFIITDHQIYSPYLYNKPNEIHNKLIEDKLLSGQWKRKFSFILLYILSFFFVVFVSTFIKNRLGWGSSIFCFWELVIVLSIFRSTNKRICIRRIIAFVGISICGCTIGMALTSEKTIITISFICLTYLIIGILNEFANKSFFKRWHYRFAGTMHPNQQGLNCVILILTSLDYIYTYNLMLKEIAVFSLLIGSIMLLLTKSRSALFSCILGISCFFFFSFFNHFFLLIFYFLIIILTAFLIIRFCFYPYSQPTFLKWQIRVISLIPGRENKNLTTFTGRTQLWNLILLKTKKSRFFGVGFGSFWTKESFVHIRKNLGWRFSDCHSVYIETLIGTGFIGLFAHFLLLASGFALPFFSFAGHTSFFSAFFLVVISHGFFESSFISPNYFTFITYLLLGIEYAQFQVY
jgi:O-antigen ligase